MRGVALSDLHLGFRQFSAMIHGRNARECDVENAWFQAVRQIIALDPGPDLITIAGDIFHHPRVSDFAKRAFLTGLVDLLEGTNAHIVVLRGNHDAGRTADVLSPVALAEILSVHRHTSRVHLIENPKRLRLIFGEEVACVACFPFVVLDDEPKAYKLEPDPDADVNILVMHAAVKGDIGGDKLPYFYGSADQALDVGREADRWDVIALGDYHETSMLHETSKVFYSGAIERTTSNIWDEKKPKGFVNYDTTQELCGIEEVSSRPMFSWSLEELEEGPPTADGINAALTTLSLLNNLTGALFRLKVDDFPLQERDHIDWSLVRALKGTCLHFYLDLRYEKRVVPDLGDRRDRRGGMSLAEEAVSFFLNDDEPVRRCAFGYLEIEADIEEVTL